MAADPDAELVEAMARAMCVADQTNPDDMVWVEWEGDQPRWHVEHASECRRLCAALRAYRERMVVL